MFDIRGWGAYQFGQIEKGTSVQGDLNKVWMQQAILQTTVDGKVGGNGHCLLSFEAMDNFSVPIIDNSDATKLPVPSFYFHEVQGTYDWGEAAKPYLSLAFGYFPYKYNPDSRNLGEYLFRSGTYPPYIINNFDFPMARLLGAHVTGRVTPFAGLDLEGQLLLTSETQMVPTKDFTLTFLPKAAIGNGFAEIQGGISFSHLISVDHKRTQPRDSRTLYLTNVVKDTAGFIVSADSNYYTFAGTKLMARFSLDPLKALKSNDDPRSLLWKEDLKLYGEGAILGMQDYPQNANQTIAYDSMWQRTPVMLGINLPTQQFASECLVPWLLGAGLEPDNSQKGARCLQFGLVGLVLGAGSWFGDQFLGWHSRLDLISFEWEYFGWKYADDYTSVFDNMIPAAMERQPGVDYAKDDTKWSLYIKKDFLKVFSFRMQLARDHMRPISNDSKAAYKSPATTYPDHWYWMAKMSYGF
jgi:hypothetical protein